MNDEPQLEPTPVNRDQRRPAARRTALIVALIAFGIYAAFFLRAVLNTG